MSLALYGRTLRHLRVQQITGRVAFRLVRPRADLSPPPARSDIRTHRWSAPARRVPSLVGATRFRLLNVEASLEQCGWNGTGPDRLWRYNQHYFDDLNARNAQERAPWHRDLVDRWIRENPPEKGAGWEPYPTSLRIVNWIKWFLSGEPVRDEWLHSLAVQTRWLSGRLEWHLLGNHLFANAKALVFAGAFFKGPEAGAWLSRGLQILAKELPEQVLPDGGQFERSMMYHALALEDVLDLLNLASAAAEQVIDGVAVAAWQSAAQRMLAFAQAFTHPDGEIVLFNDAAFGVAPQVSELESYAYRIGVKPHAAFESATTGVLQSAFCRDSGYLRLQTPDTVLFIDCAPIGPDYLPGHAHADTLTFEWSHAGRRLLVDSGTSTYEANTERLRQRGTPAHNTVAIEGRDSSEVWSSFRVGRRAYPGPVSMRSDGGALLVCCEHDGYAHLSGRPRHRRTWTLKREQLHVQDEIASTARHAATALFHFHPDWDLQMTSSTHGRLAHAQGGSLEIEIVKGKPSVVRSTYHPEFGVSLRNECLAVELESACSHVSFRWRQRG